MSYKRSRANFEDDHNPAYAPFALFGTPLPDEADARDDGSYLPLWKQEVRDERGRKRLHGAFTGGFSAGSVYLDSMADLGANKLIVMQVLQHCRLQRGLDTIDIRLEPIQSS